MNKTPLCMLALVGVMLTPVDAFCDSLAATLGEPLSEVSHAVTATLEDGIARYVERRTFSNIGSRHDEAFVSINLPAGAAATALRIRVGQKWYDGELMEAEQAERMYQELTGIGPHTPRDPALLSWEWADQLRLRVFPVPPGGTATVEYTLTVPTEYRAGTYSLTYPLADPDSGMADAVMTVEWTDGPVLVDRQPVAANQPIVLLRSPAETACGEVDLPTPCVVSRVEFDQAVSPGPADLDLAIRHTYQSDLRVVLISPAGDRYEVWNHEGGGDNDVKLKKRVELAAAEAGTWRLGVADEVGLDVGVLEGWTLTIPNRTVPVALDVPRHIPDAGGDGSVATLELHDDSLKSTVGRLGRVELKGAAATRLEIDVPARLSEMPVAPHITFVVDASRSVGAYGLEEQRRLIEGFLAHVPDARIEVVAYDRFARRIHNGFAPAAQFGELWRAAEDAGLWELGNGSNADAALALAYESLRSAKGARYVIAFSDDRLRPSWDDALTFRRTQRDDLTTHVLVVNTGGDALARDDQHRLAHLAIEDGGILVDVGNLGALDEKQFHDATLHLVRPTRIDDTTVDGFEDFPTVLPEGIAVREMGLFASPRRVRLHGKLWSRPYSTVMQSRPAFDRATAAWVFSQDLYGELDEAQMMAFAMYGRAVTPVTSYLAIEPGVRPSPVGLDRFGTGSGSFGGRGYGGAGVGVGVARMTPKIAPLLEAAARACHAQHGGLPATLTLHTTREELVDINGQVATDYQKCFVEAAWSLRLPGEFIGYETLTEVVIL